MEVGLSYDELSHPIQYRNLLYFKKQVVDQFLFFSTLLKINIIPEGPGDWQFFAYGGSELKLS